MNVEGDEVELLQLGLTEKVLRTVGLDGCNPGLMHFLNFLNGLREPMFEQDLDNLQLHLSLLTCKSNYKLQIAAFLLFGEPCAS